MRVKLQSLVKYIGFKRCLFDRPLITKYWGGKIILVGNSLLYLMIDTRKDWIKDMIEGIKNKY